MHNKDFKDFGRTLVLDIGSCQKTRSGVKAIMTCSDHGRVTTKPYTFTNEEYDHILQTGYIKSY